MTTGLKDLNQMLGGMQDSDLLILAGRPSMGKTALATTMAYNAALHFQRMYDDAREAGKLGPRRQTRFRRILLTGNVSRATGHPYSFGTGRISIPVKFCVVS